MWWTRARRHGACALVVSNVEPTDPVEVDEGDTALNAGSFTGVDVVIAQTAGPGTLVDNGDGSWSWSFASTDDLTDTVDVKATDRFGGTAIQEFELIVHNLDPEVMVTGEANPDEGGTYTYEKLTDTLSGGRYKSELVLP